MPLQKLKPRRKRESAKSQVSVPPDCRERLKRIKEIYGVNHGRAVIAGLELLEQKLNTQTKATK